MKLRPATVVCCAVLLLIAYGSLYPFNFRAWAATPGRIAGLLQLATWTTLSDSLGNVALFLPLGATVVGVLTGARHARAWLIIICLTTLIYATSLQVLQLWLPSRSATTADILWNMVGFGLGLAIGVVGLRVARANHWALTPVRYMGLALIAIWALGEVLPLVPSLDLQWLRRNLRQLWVMPRIEWVWLFYNAGGVALVAAIWGELFDRRRALFLTVFSVLVVFGLELISVDRRITLTTPLGYLLGLAIWIAVSRRHSNVRVGVVVALVVVGYTLAALAPFEFRSLPARMNWTPFAAMMRGAMAINAASLFEASFMLLAPIVILQAVGQRARLFTLIWALWTLGLELIQTRIVGRVADVTLPIIVVCFGLWLARSSRYVRPDQLAR